MQKKLEKTTAWHIKNHQNYHFHRVQSSFWVSNTTESKITQTWSLAVWKRFEDFWLGIWLNMGNRRCFAGHAFMVWPMEELGQWSIHFSRSHMSLLLPVVPGSGSLTHQHPPRFPLPALYLFFFFPLFFTISPPPSYALPGIWKGRRETKRALVGNVGLSSWQWGETKSCAPKEWE